MAKAGTLHCCPNMSWRSNSNVLFGSPTVEIKGIKSSMEEADADLSIQRAAIILFVLYPNQSTAKTPVSLFVCVYVIFQFLLWSHEEHHKFHFKKQNPYNIDL